MKNKNIIRLICGLICLICVICGLSYATTKDELNSLFYSANKLYEQGKYEDAVNEYRKIIDMGFESEPLYYNLGNCYFKLGSLGKTILYYEKAKRLLPNDPELKSNYNYVKSLLEDKIELPRKKWLIRKIIYISDLLTFGKWLGLIAVIWILFTGGIIIIIFLSAFRKAFGYFGLMLSILFAIAIVCTIIQFNIQSSPSAIILPKEVPVRYGPGEAEVEAFLLHEGTKVIIKNSQDKWYQIQLPDGKSGWLPKDTVEMV